VNEASRADHRGGEACFSGGGALSAQAVSIGSLDAATDGS
jgi:hypothetical protein